MSDSRTTTYPIDPLFTSRWSPRAFTGEAMPEATLMSLFEAARWAPSGSNAQPWRFIYALRDTPEWQPLFDALVPFNQTWACNASALVVVLSCTQSVPPGQSAPQPVPTHSFDAGAAWAMLALQAHIAGWPAHGIGGFDKARVRESLGVPADHAIEAMVAIGRQGDKSILPEGLQARETPNQRQPLARMVCAGRFGFEG